MLIWLAIPVLIFPAAVGLAAFVAALAFEAVLLLFILNNLKNWWMAGRSKRISRC